MNATKNPTETERLDALYAKLTETETRIHVLENLLFEARNEAKSLYAEIEDREQNAKKVKKNETAKPTAKKTKKSKKQSKTAAETEKPLKTLPVFDRSNHLIAYKFVDENDKEIRREPVTETATPAATETATETKKPVKKLPVFDRPNHLIAYKYLDENGNEIGREPVTETKKRTASKKKTKK